MSEQIGGAGMFFFPSSNSDELRARLDREESRPESIDPSVLLSSLGFWLLIDQRTGDRSLQRIERTPALMGCCPPE